MGGFFMGCVVWGRVLDTKSPSLRSVDFTSTSSADRRTDGMQAIIHFSTSSADRRTDGVV
ncbi:MAG TPA: hypothetical protein VLZ11_03090 [Flavobacterium sp.]|nr:hypothetical protein [Flavobacterium sp.]